MKKKRITNKDRRIFKDTFGVKDNLMCAMEGCRGIAGESQHYCYRHRSEIRLVPTEKLSISYVYFVLATGLEKVKIGVAKDPKKRLENMQVGSPARLLLLAAIPGDYLLERTLHRMLKKERGSGEWFNMSDEVIDLVEIALNEGRLGVNEWVKTKAKNLTTTTNKPINI